MHSFSATLILGIIVDFIYPSATFSFVIGMLSHILLDLFNMKKVQLFYPIKAKFGLKLCSANGYANTVIFISSISIFMFELLIFVANMFK